MILDAILALLNQCIRLLKLRKENRRALLFNDIAPIYDHFESIHHDYLTCFETYRAMFALPVSLDSSHPVFDQIASDHVFTEGARGKLAEMGKAIPKNSRTYRVDDFDMFMWSIASYFNWAEQHVFHDEPFSNDPRSCLLSGLKFIFEREWTEQEQAHVIAKIRDGNELVYYPKDLITAMKEGISDGQFFLLNFRRSPDWANRVVVELQHAKGDSSSTKRVLAKALVYSIVDQNQRSFGYVSKYFFQMKKALS